LNITWLGWDFNNGYIKVSGSSLWTNFNLHVINTAVITVGRTKED
jgi:hypothetical protein